jgi:hypothetical protein
VVGYDANPLDQQKRSLEAHLIHKFNFIIQFMLILDSIIDGNADSYLNTWKWSHINKVLVRLSTKAKTVNS